MTDETRGARPQRNKLRERLWTIFFMLAASFLFTSAVSLTYLETKDRISRNERLFLQRAVLRAAAITVPKSDAAVVSTFAERIREVRRNGEAVVFFRVLAENGTARGAVIPARGQGLWGAINAVVGFEADRTTLTGVDFTSHNETPGLGGRISEDWFRSQFEGKRGPFTMVPEHTPNEQANEFDAVTGATITSTAVKTMLNAVCAEVHDIVRGEEVD